jgi:hypothetical protein
MSARRQKNFCRLAVIKSNHHMKEVFVMLLQKMLEQFENVGGAEKLGPVTSMMLISLWRKAEKLNNQQRFSMSSRELMFISGIRKINDFTQALNRLVNFGYIRYKYSRDDEIEFYLNFNLYKPFKRLEKKETTTYKDVMDALETQYIQLRGNGMFLSPLDYEEMRKVADTDITVEQAIEWLNECFENYTPKYKDDAIRSFKYCAKYIMNKLAIEQAKKGVGNHGENERNDGKDHTDTLEKESTASSIVRRKQKELREKGFFRNLGDVKCNF